ncbi:hypothetical protein HU200_054620 [Digitaria exilis]|uniref:F-box domain-containing protein n=1 Tax=Digitaria exilis TaxID=1010633 RepID=A0A835E5B2_9POAL|nr:hypothetical protein HU200_054620 [Digitaria exilis]CAB3458287.1 unnamed protein product [Digitaria exilis]
MAASPAGELALTDDILADILIRLPTLADFGRACASCPAFRRVITAHPFLRRLHALHPPSIFGTRTFFGFHPIEPPNPSAPAGRAIAEASDFDLSFLPKPGFWMVRDELGGRFVVDRDEGRDDTFTTIAVCDPLFRRYVILPPIPAELAATVQKPYSVNAERRCDVFLAPSDDDEEEVAAGAPKSFKVIWMAQCPTKVIAFVFSSTSNQWRAVAPARWSDLNRFMPSAAECKSLRCRNYAYGCFYWNLSEYPYGSNLIVLDMDKMEFFPAENPPIHSLEQFAIVELGESRCGMFTLDTNNIEGGVLRVFSANIEIHDVCPSEWVLENALHLPDSYKYDMLGVADGKLLMVVTQTARSSRDVRCVSLDFKTLQRQEIRGIIHRDFLVPVPLPALYIGYPPSLSLPTI